MTGTAEEGDTAGQQRGRTRADLGVSGTVASLTRAIRMASSWLESNDWYFLGIIVSSRG